MWCALRAENYAEGVLAAVNLGEDTDTTAAVTGAILGIRFGIDNVQEDWINTLAKREEIFNLCDQLQKKCEQKWNRKESNQP